MRKVETAEGRSVRLLRVGEQVRHALSDILMRGDVHDRADGRELAEHEREGHLAALIGQPGSRWAGQRRHGNRNEAESCEAAEPKPKH